MDEIISLACAYNDIYDKQPLPFGSFHHSFVGCLACCLLSKR